MQIHISDDQIDLTVQRHAGVGINGGIGFRFTVLPGVQFFRFGNMGGNFTFAQMQRSCARADLFIWNWGTDLRSAAALFNDRIYFAPRFLQPLLNPRVQARFQCLSRGE